MPESKRYRANRPLTVGPNKLTFAVGDECKGDLPEGWPSKKIIDLGWVSEIPASEVQDEDKPVKVRRPAGQIEGSA